MSKPVKYILIAFAALIALLLIAAGILAATFNPNDYKPLLIRLTQEKKQRTLSIPGDIKLSFFPRLGVDLGQVGISERNSRNEFASLESAKVSLALMPLLSKQLVVDRITINGMRAHIKRFENGSTNFDDLLAKEKNEGNEGEKGPGRQFKFDIDSVDISNADVVFDDLKEGRKVELAQLDLETGRIANDAPSNLKLSSGIKADKPAVDAKLALKSGFTMDLERGRYVLKGLDAQLTGTALNFTGLALKLAGDADLTPASKRFALDGIKFSGTGKREGQPIDLKFEVPKLAVTDTQVSGDRLSGTANMTQGARAIAIDFNAPSFTGSPQAFKLPTLNMQATLKEAQRDVNAKLNGALEGNIDKLLFNSPRLTLNLSGKQGATAIEGALTTPLAADLGKKTIALPNLAADFSLPNPGGGSLRLKAGGSAQANLDRENMTANLKGSLDESAFDAKLGMTKFSPAAYTFDISIDRLDLDRYQGKPAAAAPKKAAPEQEKAPDLSALRDLRANGHVRIGALKAKNIRASNLRFDLHAAGGKLDIDPLAANLYGGSVAGALSLTASNPARFTARQTLTGINIGPLLKDALGKEPMLEGRGNVRLDVSSGGATFAQIKKGLNGSARLELHDGTVRGINIAQTVRTAKARIGELSGGQPPAQAGTSSAGEKTDFSELSGSFRINNGVAHNDDLNGKSPLLRIGGSGNIDLGAEQLDYLVRATVVESLQGQGGPELQALKGVTVPVRLSGPFKAINWRIDFSSLMQELAKKKLEQQKEEMKSKGQKALEEEKRKLQEQLMKGLLGR